MPRHPAELASVATAVARIEGGRGARKWSTIERYARAVGMRLEAAE